MTQEELIELNKRLEAALWEILDKMRMVDAYHMGVKEILDKHGVTVPEHIVLL